MIVVHLHDLAPVRCNLGQIRRLGQVDKVENVLLEAAAAKPNAGLEELGAEPRVAPNRARDFAHVSTRGFTDCAHGVNAGDSLRKERICSLPEEKKDKHNMQRPTIA